MSSASLPQAPGFPASEPDARVVRSRAAIQQALAELLAEHALEQISIAQLCRQAGISRPTFYQHHADVDDAYAALVRTQLEGIGAQVLVEPDGARRPPRQTLAATLELLRQHRQEIGAVIESSASMPRARATVVDWLRDVVAQRTFGAAFDQQPQAVRRHVVYAVGGLAAVLEEEYLHDDLSASVDEVSADLRQLMLGSLGPAEDGQG